MFNNPKKNKVSEQEKEYNETKKMFQSMGPGTITLLVLVGFVLTLLIGYTFGVSSAIGNLEQNLGMDFSSNLGSGKTYTFAGNETPVAECVVYSDEVLISEDDCESHVDCAPNGICLKDINKCAYFLN